MGINITKGPLRIETGIAGTIQTFSSSGYTSLGILELLGTGTPTKGTCHVLDLILGHEDIVKHATDVFLGLGFTSLELGKVPNRLADLLVGR